MSDPSASQPVNPRKLFQSSDKSLAQKLYAQMALIRTFEEELLALFETGELVGTTHCYIGQEANAVGIINHLNDRDIIFSNHRCHGHFLTYTDHPRLLAGELMGRDAGVVGGRGGSQHICFQIFYTNGIQGGIVPTATGMALAEKEKQSDAIAVAFLGDGTLGEGIVYEALNMASLWDAPILFVVENNRWAQSSRVSDELAGDMVARGQSFGIDAGEIESYNAAELYEHFEPIIEKVRETQRPHFEVLHTYRLCHHSKSDDQRPKDEVEAHRKNDPLPILERHLEQDVIEEIQQAQLKRVTDAFEWAQAQDPPHPSELDRPADARLQTS